MFEMSDYWSFTGDFVGGASRNFGSSGGGWPPRLALPQTRHIKNSTVTDHFLEVIISTNERLICFVSEMRGMRLSILK